MLDIHQLNVFLVAAETLNFTRAAQQLHMTQPSVSQHISNLERHFDLPLFLRNGRSLELTDAGMALLPLVRDAAGISVRIDEVMESLKGSIYGHLIVGCSTTPGKYLLPQLLAGFHRKHPQVRVSCQVSPQIEALKNVAEGDSHFVLFSLDNNNFYDIEAIPFVCDPILLIVPLNHPWAKKGEIEPTDLLNGEFIMRETTSGTSNAVWEALSQKDISISDLRVLITLGNSEAIALAVQEGIGVGFVSKLVIDLLCQNKVAVVKIRGIDICRQIYIGRNNRRPATGAQTAFWNFLTSHINTIEVLAK